MAEPDRHLRDDDARRDHIDGRHAHRHGRSGPAHAEALRSGGHAAARSSSASLPPTTPEWPTSSAPCSRLPAPNSRPSDRSREPRGSYHHGAHERRTGCILCASGCCPPERRPLMKRVWFVAVPALLVGVLLLARGSGLTAQQPAAPPSPQPAPAPAAAPEIPFDSSTDFLKYSPDMNFGEVLGVAINSKNHLVVLNHPGQPDAGSALRQRLHAVARIRPVDRPFRSRGRPERLWPRLRSRHPLRQVRQPLGRGQGHERRRPLQSRRIRHDEPGPPAGRPGRSGGVVVPERAGRCAASAKPGRLLSRSDRYRVRLERQHVHQRRLHQRAHRQVRPARASG